VEVHHEGCSYEHHDPDGGQVCPVGDEPGEGVEDPWGGVGPLHHDVPCPGWFVIQGVVVDHEDVVWDFVLVT